MRKKISSNKVKILGIIGVIVVLCWQFYMLSYMGIINDDTWSGILRFKSGLDYKTVGRIPYLLLSKVYWVQIVFADINIYWFRFFTIIALLFSSMAMGYLAEKLLKRGLKTTYVVLFFVCFQFTDVFNGMIAYSWDYQLSVGIFACSIIYYIKYLEDNRCKKWLIISALLYLLSMWFYELYIPMGIVFFLVCILHSYKKIKEYIKVLWIHFVTAVVYSVAWYFLPLIWGGGNASRGDAEIGDFLGWKEFFFTLYDVTFALIPLKYARRSILELWTSFSTLSIEARCAIVVVASVAVAIIVYEINNASSKMNMSIKRFIQLEIFCILSALTTNVLIAVAGIFQYRVTNRIYTQGFSTSFHAYFFLIMALLILAVFVYSKINNSWRWVMNVFASILMFYVIICTSLYNYNYANAAHPDYERRLAFIEFVHSGIIDNIEDDTIIYMPDYNGLWGYMDGIDEYIYNETGKTVHCIRELSTENEDNSEILYVYWKPEIDGLISMENGYSDSINVFVNNDEVNEIYVSDGVNTKNYTLKDGKVSVIAKDYLVDEFSIDSLVFSIE